MAPRLVNPDGTLQPTLRRAADCRRGALAEAIVGGELAGGSGSANWSLTSAAMSERVRVPGQRARPC